MTRFQVLSNLSKTLLTNLNRQKFSSHYTELGIVRYSTPAIVNKIEGCDSNQTIKSIENQTDRYKTPEFDNSKIIYQSKRTSELLRAYAIFTACSFDVLVNNQATLLRLTRTLLGSRGFIWLLKKTLCAQFMVGMGRDDLVGQAARHSKAGIFPMYAYTASELHGGPTNPGSSSEVSLKENWFKTNVTEISRSIQIASECKGLTTTKPFVSTKLTFMTSAELLRSFSTVISEQSALLRQLLTEKTKGQQHYEELVGFITQIINETQSLGNLPAVNIPKGDLIKNINSLLTSSSFHLLLNQKLDKIEILPNNQIKKLTIEERKAISEIWQKMKQLNQLTVSSDIQLNYDAEQTYLQPAIDCLTLDSMRESNKSAPHILNTYQCYLKRTLGIIERDLEICSREGFCFGGKIVRGAYVDEETRLSREHGYSNPVNDSYDATTHMYSSVMSRTLDYCNSLSPGSTRLVFATHNKETVASVIEEMKKRGLNPVTHGVSFAQLLGMRDYISFALGAAGYSAGKLIHYASPESGVAYLSRRLSENRSGLPSPAIERKLLSTEIKERFIPGSRN